jgi:hypothetical protein
MGIKTDLNVAPYHDDFTEASEFYRVLFRPGYSIQARELTTLQTMLQTQITRFGKHMFKENSMVIPGQATLDKEYEAVKLQPSFDYPDPFDTTQTISSEPDYYVDEYIGSIITGATSGVSAKVVNAVQLTSDDPITLYVKYTKTGTVTATNGTVSETSFFIESEKISSNKIISVFSENDNSAITLDSDATAVGCAISINPGVYFVRGHFVQNVQKTIILDKYTNFPSYSIGFKINELLENPENDNSLLDNSTGTTNFSAKGAHRLKIELEFSAFKLNTLPDSNFIELIKVIDGLIVERVNRTDYALIAKEMARRTHDESGDYTLGSYKFAVKEHLNDGYNGGIYTTIGDESKMVLQVSSGKSYVKGFEVHTRNPKFIDIDKARDYLSKQNALIPIKYGDSIIITNVSGMPDIVGDHSSITQYNEVLLFDKLTVVGGQSSGNQIGSARIKALEYIMGDISIPGEPGYNAHLFDIQMNLDIVVDQSSSYAIGSYIKGSISGATGYVVESTTNLGYVKLNNTTGKFVNSEILVSSNTNDTTGSSILGFTKWSISNVKQLLSTVFAGGTNTFTADVDLNNLKLIIGRSTLNYTAGGGSAGYGTVDLTGIGSTFDQELLIGDIVRYEDFGVTLSLVITSVIDKENATSDVISNNATTFFNAAAEIFNANLTRVRTTFTIGANPSLLFPLKKRNIKSLKVEPSLISDTTFEYKRQYIGNADSNGTISFNCNSIETFGDLTNNNYILSTESGTPIYVDITSSTTGIGTNSITITNTNLINQSVKLIATIKKSIGQEKTKTINKSAKKVISSNSLFDPYGNRVFDDTISLGVTDGLKLRAIYASNNALNPAVSPTLTISNLQGATSGTINPGDILTGDLTNALGVVISFDSITNVIEYYETFNTFDVNETILYNDNTATISSLTDGDDNIIFNYLLDNGHRPSYYDVSRIIRNKSTGIIPNQKQLLIIFDYFTHSSTGDYFTIDSYENQINRSDIPVNIINGEIYNLGDVFDFRSSIAIPTANINHFIFANRSFDSTGANVINPPRINHSITTDFEYYLSRIDHLYLKSNGSFIIQKGTSSEVPVAPPTLNDSMKLCAITIPAFTDNLNTIKIVKIDNKRYTMRDIGNIVKRIDRLEYYTSLNLLESNTMSMQIFDGDGFDRFKSGFMVDNFSSFASGNWAHYDHNVSIDPNMGILKPAISIFDWSIRELIDDASYMRWLQNGLTDTQISASKITADLNRSGNNYQKTGPLITLPYEDVVFTSQNFASHIENVNPYAIQVWTAGTLKLDPPGDTWISTLTSRWVDPVVLQGNYDKVLSEAKTMGTVYNSWVNTGVAPSESSTVPTTSTSWIAGDPRVVSNSLTDLLNIFPGRDIIDPGTTHINFEAVNGTGIYPPTSSAQKRLFAQWKLDNPAVEEMFQSNDQDFLDILDSGEVELGRRGDGNWERLTRLNFEGIAAGWPLTELRYLKETTQQTGFQREIETQTTTENTFQNQSRSGFKLGAEEVIVEKFTGITRTEGKLLPKIRAKKIFIEAHNMKPNTTIYPFFDGIGVSQYTQNFADTEPGAKLETDSSGHWKGYFNLPNGEFDTGVTTLKLTDHKFNSNIKGIVKTTSEGIYSTHGREINEEYNYTSTRNGRLMPIPVDDQTRKELVNTSVSSNTIITDGRTEDVGEATTDWVRQDGKLVYIDPLAQTFVVGNNEPGGVSTEDGGVFVTKLDLFFQTKDENLPINVSIRTTLNGYPTTQVIPFGEVILNPVDVNVPIPNSDGITPTEMIPTTFTFEAPIHLKEGHEYCIVIISNSNEYNCWVSTLGEKDLGGSSISTNPHLGVFFKSQNASTWTPEQETDLAFTLYKAKFDTASSGLVRFKNKLLVDAFTVIPNGLEFKSGQNKFKVHKNNHGFSPATTSHNVLITSASEIIAGNGIAGIPLSEINKLHTTITDIETNSFCVPTTTFANATTRGGGRFIRSSRNIPYEIIQPSIRTIDFEDTSIQANITSTTAGYKDKNGTVIESAYNRSRSENISLNSDFMTETPSILASNLNEASSMEGSESLNINLIIKSNNVNVSPVIDTDFMSCQFISHRINSVDSASDIGGLSEYSPSTEAQGDNNLAIYITREIRLEVPSSSIQTMFAGVVESDCDVIVLYKLKPTGSTEIFDEIGWEYFNIDGKSNKTLPVSSHSGEFYDRLYTANDLDEFESFAIKIVMKSTNPTKQPSIRDFRSIALV